MKSEMKELRVYLHYVNQTIRKSLPGQKPKYLKGLGVGMGVLAQSL